MPVIDGSDTVLVRRLRDLAMERGISQAELESRTGIPQSTISRWFRMLEAGDPIPLRAKNRNAIRAYLARAGDETVDRAVVLARQFAADILRDVSEALRAGATEAPDDALPPTVRRLLGGEEATESGADADPIAARLERMMRDHETVRARKRRRRTERH